MYWRPAGRKATHVVQGFLHSVQVHKEKLIVNEWTALIAGLSLAVGLVVGALLFDLRARKNEKFPLRMPARWPLRSRSIVKGNEKAVWAWLRKTLPGHVVMVKVPILRFTLLHERKNAVESAGATTKGGVQDDNSHLLNLLNGLYTSFSVFTVDGKIVGCVDISGSPSLTKGTQDLKDMLFLDCSIPYLVISPLALPSASSIRLAFLGESPSLRVDHPVTRGGDTDFHLDLKAFSKNQSQKIA